MESAMRRPGVFNLTAALAVVAVLELFVNRLFGRLFMPGAISSGRSGFNSGRALEASGSFLFQLTAVLALAVLVAAFWGLLRRGELYPRAVRFSVVIITLFFTVFAAHALVRGQMPPRHFLFLEIGFAFLAILTVFALSGSRVPLRVKVGVALFALPGILRAFAIVLSGRGAGSGGARYAVLLAGAGEGALVLAAIVAPFTLVPRPWKQRRWLLPLAISAALTTVLVVAIAWRFDLVHESALYALRIDLPRLASLTGVGHVLAFAGWSFAAVELIRHKGGLRLAAYGLILLALGGYETGSPVELSLSLLGLVALALGELRAAPGKETSQPRVATPEWRAFVGRLLTAATDNTAPDNSRPEAVWVDDGDIEIDRIRTHRRGYPLLIKLRRRRGVAIELDAVVGTPKHDQPDASVERHRRWLARSPEHRLKLVRSRTGDDTFDRKFSVHGQAPLADEQLRHRIARQQGDGVITIWNATAARYHLLLPNADVETLPVFAGKVEGAAPVDTIVDIVDTLVDLVEAAPASPA
jgi:hypothetical protein